MSLSKIYSFKVIILGGLFFLFSIPTTVIAQQLKISELNIGLDSRWGAFKNVDPNTNIVTSKVFHQNWNGLSARFQSSMLAEYLLREKQEKFIWGDVLAGEIGFGFFSSDSTGNSVRFNYRFDFGFGCITRIHNNHDFGINMLLLKFSNDGIVPNGSGSAITLRYRYKNFIIEPTLDAHRQRVIGWLQGLNSSSNLTLKAGLCLRYQINSEKQIGVRYEQMPINKIKYVDYDNQSQFWYALRIFYGITF